MNALINKCIHKRNPNLISRLSLNLLRQIFNSWRNKPRAGATLRTMTTKASLCGVKDFTMLLSCYCYLARLSHMVYGSMLMFTLKGSGSLNEATEEHRLKEGSYRNHINNIRHRGKLNKAITKEFRNARLYLTWSDCSSQVFVSRVGLW